MCGRYAVGDLVTIRVNCGVAHYAHTIRCGSATACAVCAPKIAARRADEISARCAVWLAAGNSLIAVALTFPHDLGMPLAETYDAVAKGWSAVIRGRPWKRVMAAADVAGYWRAVEVTHGPSGWHPHLHCLIAARGEIDALGLYALESHIKGRWSSWMTSRGYRQPSEAHGVKFDRVVHGAAAGEYLAKIEDAARPVGNELARADMKAGRDGRRSPLQILADWDAHGDPADLRLWREYERATYRRKRITEGGNLAAELPPVIPVLTDEEITNEDIGGEDVASLPAEDWSLVLSVIPGLPGELLTAAAVGGRAAVAVRLLDYGFRLGPPGG
jgi:hypothetical protein